MQSDIVMGNVAEYKEKIKDLEERVAFLEKTFLNGVDKLSGPGCG